MSLCDQCLQALDAALCNYVRVVATLQHHEESLLTIVVSEAPQAARKPAKSLWRYATFTQRITLGRIETSRHQYRFRLELPQQWADDMLHHIGHVGISVALVKRHVHRVPSGTTLASVF